MESFGGYETLNELGRGYYGIVYLVKKDDKKYALKKFTDGLSNDSLNELDILSRIEHPNIVKLHEIIFLENSCIPCLILELAERDLGSYLKDHNLDVVVKYKMMYQLASALEFLHKNYIIHSDLKPGNILVKNNNVMIADFGESKIYYKNHKIIERKAYEEITTSWWRAPELFTKEKINYYDYKIDIWSLALIFIEILSGRYTWSFELLNVNKIDEEVEYYAKEIVDEKHILDYLEKIDLPEREELIDLLKGMLRIDPKNRLSSSQVVDHSFFKNFQKVPGIYREEIFKIRSKIKSDFRKTIWDMHKANFSFNVLLQALDLYDRYTSIKHPKDNYEELITSKACLYLFCFYEGVEYEYFEYIKLTNPERERLYDILRTLNFSIFRPNLYMLYPDKVDKIFDLLMKKGSPDEFSVEWID